MKYPQESGSRQTIEYTTYDGNGKPLEIQYRSDDNDTSPRIKWTITYDSYGRLESRDGVDENSPTEEFFGTAIQEFEYDDLGRMVFARDHSPESEFTDEEDIEAVFSYDTAGRKLSENQRLPIGTSFEDHLVESQYAVDGFREQLLFPDAEDDSGNALERYYINFYQDPRGRIEYLKGPDSPTAPLVGNPWPERQLTHYRYVGGQVWDREYGNETALRFYEDGTPGSQTLLYDGLGRPRGMRTLSDTASLEVADFRYGYDRVGNLTHEQRRHEEYSSPGGTYRTRAYSTDLMGRLTEWAEGDLGVDPIPATEPDPASVPGSPTDSESWTLDLVGNWDDWTESGTTHDFDTNALNQYTQVSEPPQPGENFVHDWLGQMREDDGKDHEYVWDVFGRLSQVLDLNTGDLIAQYRYDALNRRVERHVPSPPAGVSDINTRFIYDGWRAVEERAVVPDDPDYEIVRARYGFGLSLDEVLWMDRDLAADGAIESRFFIHHDLKGSATAVTDDPSDPTTVEIVERFTYSAYGTVSAWWDPAWDNLSGEYPPPAAGVSEVSLPYLYTGQRFDVESGLHYYKNRSYDPESGRFLRRDWIGYADGPSLYQYGSSNPSVIGDPLGLKGEPWSGWDPSSYKDRDPYEVVKEGKAVSPLPRGLGCTGLGVAWKSCAERDRDYDRRRQMGPWINEGEFGSTPGEPCKNPRCEPDPPADTRPDGYGEEPDDSEDTSDEILARANRTAGVQLFYSISRGTVLVVAGGRIYELKVTSGRDECMNNSDPSCLQAVWEGPIPTGTYTGFSKELSDPSLVGDLRAATARSGRVVARRQ